ncbi:unnamed protein product [Citrullus colocynthis]|uniref:Uncharacterized protein n=1 Tax=Citrullus colocynthis TaxID=252529 RepID=A0ABP0Y2D3_9ROSI
MANSSSDPNQTNNNTKGEVTKMATPSSAQRNSATNSDLAPIIQKFQVRYDTCPVDNPSFTNLLNQVTSIKLDRGNFLLWQNIVLPNLRSYKLGGHLIEKKSAPKHLIIIPPSEEEP